jgi:hypothetical protein
VGIRAIRKYWFSPRPNPEQDIETKGIGLARNHTITITRTGNSIDPIAPFTVKKNDTLKWTCSGGEYAVLFHNNRSPFANGKKVHAAHSGAATTKLKIRGLKQAEQDAEEDDPVNGATFKYGVAVLHPGTGKVLTLDPDVIIDDPGGGG